MERRECEAKKENWRKHFFCNHPNWNDNCKIVFMLQPNPEHSALSAYECECENHHENYNRRKRKIKTINTPSGLIACICILHTALCTLTNEWVDLKLLTQNTNIDIMKSHFDISSNPRTSNVEHRLITFLNDEMKWIFRLFASKSQIVEYKLNFFIFNFLVSIDQFEF